MIKHLKQALASEMKALQVMYVIVGLLFLLSMGIIVTGFLSEIWRMM